MYKRQGHERVFDLYCGIGTIGLSLAARAREVVGVELVETAVSDAIENARLNEITNASFFAGDIRLAMRELVERAGRASAPGTAARSRASCATSSSAKGAARTSSRSASSPRPASSTPTR